MGNLVIKLPDVGEGTAQAELASWLVKVGDDVSEDQNLAEITTDKATIEIPSPVSGRVAALHGTPGDMISVGARLIELETEAAAKSNGKEAQVVTETPAPKKSEAPPREKMSSKALASPAVRDRARHLKIDLTQVTGTGAEGRVLHKDLDNHFAHSARSSEPRPAPVISTEVQETKVIGIRRKIAERMQESKRHIPHYSYVEEVDVTALEELRARLNEEGKGKLSVLPFVVLAMRKAIAEFPVVNAHYDDETGTLRQYPAVHAGIATQTDKGLMVPVVFDIARHDIWSLSAEIARVAEAARTGSADRKELMGSTITVTSLGRLGGIVTTPVINRPEVAIIGINKVVQRPIAQNGAVVVRAMMNLSSSFDHRIVDGWVAASFIQRVRTLLEQPALLFM